MVKRREVTNSVTQKSKRKFIKTMDISNHKLFLTIKDHSVSGEIFELYHDKEQDLVYTHPQPSEQNLPSYYESENYISHTDGKRLCLKKPIIWLRVLH